MVRCENGAGERKAAMPGDLDVTDFMILYVKFPKHCRRKLDAVNTNRYNSVHNIATLRCLLRSLPLIQCLCYQSDSPQKRKQFNRHLLRVRGTPALY